MRALFFDNFLTLKMGDDPNNKVSSVNWFPVGAKAVLRKANLIFQWISLSNATLLSIVFFACGVHKLNYIKNDFV